MNRFNLRLWEECLGANSGDPRLGDPQAHGLHAWVLRGMEPGCRSLSLGSPPVPTGTGCGRQGRVILRLPSECSGGNSRACDVAFDREGGGLLSVEAFIGRWLAGSHTLLVPCSCCCSSYCRQWNFSSVHENAWVPLCYCVGRQLLPVAVVLDPMEQL